MDEGGIEPFKSEAVNSALLFLCPFGDKNAAFKMRRF
jgi:hypothetical protein